MPIRTASRPSPTHRTLAAAGAVVLAAVAVGCGDVDDERPSQPVRPPTTDAPPTTPPAPAPDTTTTTAPASPDLDAVSVTLAEVATGLDRPAGFAVRPGDPGRRYVVEQRRGLRAIAPDGTVEPEPVLDLSGELSSGNEQGLLGVEFSADGDLVWVNFTDRGGDTRIQEFAMVDGRADLDSRRELLRIDQPFANHNGGHLVRGPDDLLYVGVGDGGSGGDPQGHGQDRSTLLGTILRIDPRPQGTSPYSVPGDNPFVDDPDARAEIWQWGLRNPWRFSFDRQTGDLWIADVGQRAREEVNWAPAGEAGVNWGWAAREGTLPFDGRERPPGARDPVYDYGRDEGISVTGGFVYRGDAIPALRGAYVFADFGVGDLVALVVEDGEVVERRDLGVNGGAVSSFGEDPDGELYVLDLGGRVLRLDPA